MSTDPLVSVLMSVYDRTEYLREAVDSILGQTYRNFEFLIVVEFSEHQQELCGILKSYRDERIRVIRNDERLGFAASLNRGIDEARGKYIARMDDDDISLPERLEVEVDFMEAHPDIDVVGSWVKFFGLAESVEPKPETHEEILVFAIKYCPVWHPTVMMRKRTLDKYGFRYDPAWLAEDYELWCRMLNQCRFANIPKVLTYYRWEGQNSVVSQAAALDAAHPDIMRRSLKEKLGLDLSWDQAQILRDVSIREWCTGEWMMWTEYWNVLDSIFHENERKRTYDRTLLERFFDLSSVKSKGGVSNIFHTLRKSSKTIFYGAGYNCMLFLDVFELYGLAGPVEIWDLAAEEKQPVSGIPVVAPKFAEIAERYADAVFVITIEKRKIADAVKQQILDAYAPALVYESMDVCLTIGACAPKRRMSHDFKNVYI